MTKSQRRAKAKRAGARRRKVNAAVVAWKRMNPGKKLPAAVRVKRLTGGGFSITPVRMNVQRRIRGRFAADSPKLKEMKRELRKAQARARTRLKMR